MNDNTDKLKRRVMQFKLSRSRRGTIVGSKNKNGCTGCSKRKQEQSLNNLLRKVKK